MAPLIAGKKYQAELLEGPVVRISGQLREDFTSKEMSGLLLGALGAFAGKQISIDLGGVTVLNSVGINQWITLVAALEKVHPLHFSVVSEVFIEIGFMIPNIFGKRENTIGMLKLPYRCPACKQTVSKAFEARNLKDAAGDFVVPAERCPTCSGPLEFDAIEEEYQGFLKRRM